MSTPAPNYPNPAEPKPLLENMTWPEARRAALANRVVLLPVGAIEQHGPHMPVDVDNRIVTWLCDEAARRRPDLIMSVPPIHYGFNTHNMGFPGTVSVEVEHFVNYVADVCRSFVRQGHKRIILINGHGSNAMPCALVARKIVNEHDDAVAAAINHWNLGADLAKRIRETPPGGMAHACEFEMSWYLHLAPELLYPEKAVADMVDYKSDYVQVDLMAGDGPVAFIDDWSRQSNGSGTAGDPTTATAEKGRQYAEEELRHLIAYCAEFQAMKVEPRRNYTARGTDPNPYYEA
jgi:creatinine amidohydrolase